MSTTRFQVHFEVSGDGQVKAAMGDVGKAAEQLERSGDRAAGGLKRMEAAGSLAGAALGAALVGGLALVVRNTINAEKEQAQLEAVLRSTGNAAGYTKDQLNAMAETLDRTTQLSAGEITEAQTRLLSYSGVVGEVFPRALQAAIDQSARLGISVTQSAEIVGRALKSPTKAAAALAQQGFGAAFTDAVKDAIEALEDAGETAAAQRMILEILEESYEGAAEAARGTFGGALGDLGDALNDVTTGSDGSLDGTTDAVNALTDTLRSEETKAAFAAFIGGLADMANFAVTAIGRIMELRAAANIAGAGGELGGASEGAASERLAQINKRLKDLEAAQGGDPRALARIAANTDLTSPSQWTVGGQQAALQAERQRIMQQLQQRRIDAQRAQWQSFDHQTQAPVEWLGVDLSGKDKDKGKKGRKAALTEEQKAALALQRAYESMNGSLHKQEELYGQTGEAAKLRYELEHGALVGLEPALAAELMQRAERIDQMDAEAEAQKELDRITKEREDAINRGIEAAARMIDDMEFELALMTMGNAEREREIALRYAGAHATEEQRARIAELADEMTRAQKEQALWNDIQRDTADMLFELSEDLGNAEEIIKGFLDSVAANIRRSIAEDWSESITNWAKNLFKNSGSGGGGGGGGGFWGTIMSWFGGGMAEGGPVRGPGTSTSDSIIARLSNREFVMKASAVDHYGEDFMHAINNGRLPAFALGGVVGTAAAAANASTFDGGWGGGAVYNINVGVEGRVDRYTRAQAADEIRRSLQQNARNQA